MYVYIPHNFIGGKVLAFDQRNKNRLYVTIRSLKDFSSAKMNKLSKALKAKIKQIATITKYGSRFKTAIDKFEQSLKKDEFNIVQEKLQELKSAADDFRAHLNAVSEQNRQNIRIKILTKILIFQLSNVDQLNIATDTEHVRENEQGQVISFNGSICLHELCFEEVHVKIYDLLKSSFDKCNSTCQNEYLLSSTKNSVSIDVTFLKNQYLSKRIQIKKDMKMKIIVSKTTSDFKASFNAFINFFENFSQASILILNNTVQVSSVNTHVLGNKSFIIESKHSLYTATWKNIIKKITGISYQAGKDMLKTAQNVYSTIATKTYQRLRSTFHRLRKARKSLKHGQLEFNKIEKKFKESQKKLKIEEVLIRIYSSQEYRNQTLFNSLLAGKLGKLFIQRIVDANCKIRKCEEQCINMTFCDTCRDPLTLNVTTLKCLAKSQEIPQRVTSQKQQKCYLTQYKITSVRTGNCPKGFSSAKHINSAWFLFVPGFGPFLSLVHSLIPACDLSYETIKTASIKEKDCFRLVTEVRTITHQYSECNDTEVKAKTGFEMPYRCNCTTVDCIIKTPNQSCLVENRNCDNSIKNILSRTTKIPKMIKILYDKLKMCQENVAASLLRIQGIKKTLQLLKQQHRQSENMLKSLEEELKFAKKSHSVVILALKTDTCISNAYLKNKNLSELVNFKHILFDGVLPLVNNIRLNAQIKYQDKDSSISFVHDLNNDYEVSMKAFSRKIFTSVLCKQTRERRSIESPPEIIDLTFNPWYVDPNATASVAKIACVTLKRTLEFLRKTIRILKEKSAFAINFKTHLQYSTNKLTPLLRTTFSANSGRVNQTNKVLKANQVVLMSTHYELMELQQQVSAKNVLKSWQNEAEILTGFQNISICFSYNDCIDNAIETLTNLPTMFNKPRKKYIEEIFSLKREIVNVFREENLTQLSTTVESIEKSILYIKHMSLHCVEPPKPTIVNATDMNLEEGMNFTLKCSAKSIFPIKYHWEHNGEILDNENSDELNLSASKETQGLYACVAKSLVGNGASSQVGITVHRKPKFIKQPADRFYVLPAHSSEKLILTCNVTDYPQTAIEWFSRPLASSRQPNIFLNETGPLLIISNPTQQESGFYFCQALNKYGKIKSREAKIEVLHSALVDAEINFSFDIINSSGISIDSFRNLSAEMLLELKELDNKMNITIINNRKTCRVNFQIQVSPKINTRFSLEEMFNISTKMRQNMASSVAVFIKKLVKNRFYLILNKKDIVHVDNETISYKFKLDICKAGYELHANGFLCGKFFFQYHFSLMVFYSNLNEMMIITICLIHKCCKFLQCFVHFH